MRKIILLIVFLFSLSFSDNTYRTDRIRVYGGWLMRTVYVLEPDGDFSAGGVAVSTVFIPDPEHKWKYYSK